MDENVLIVISVSSAGNESKGCAKPIHVTDSEIGWEQVSREQR